jgi:hypothetical protein
MKVVQDKQNQSCIYTDEQSNTEFLDVIKRQKI